MGSNKPVSRKEELVVQEHDGEVLIYDLKENKAFCLNETSALVWQACDGKKTIADISDHLGKQLKSQANEDLVWLALDQLSKANLIEQSTAIEDRFVGLSRREAIRRVGMASLVALPVIATLTAPTAAQTGTCVQTSTGCTGSNRPRGCDCSSNANCATGLTCNTAVSGGTCC